MFGGTLRTLVGAGLVAGMVVAIGAAPPAAARTPGLDYREDRPGLSGTKTFEAHTLTWSVSGAVAVPAAQTELAASYDGVVSPGSTVTFVGAMSYSIAQGYVTNLSQSASLSGAPPAQDVSYSERVGGGSYTTPFNLISRAPKATADVPKGTVIGTVTASASTRNCNDYGVCGGAGVTITLAVVSGGLDTTPPTVSVRERTAVVPIGKAIPARFSVRDNSGKAKWYGTLYSGGQPIAKAQSKGLVAAKGKTIAGKWSSGGTYTGPFYYCFWAEDAAGNVSANAPYTSCQWLSVQVPIPAVSNGCGTSALGETVETILNWAGDVQMYGTNPVNIRPACNQHDAGYAGATVAGLNTKKVTDYRTWSRSQVDEKFYRDIVKQCKRFLKGPANAAYLKQCKEDSYTYVGLVRGSIGRMSFDADMTTPGTQPDQPASTTPPGGARVND